MRNLRDSLALNSKYAGLRILTSYWLVRVKEILRAKNCEPLIRILCPTKAYQET
jgi:hypothetical protein